MDTLSGSETLPFANLVNCFPLKGKNLLLSFKSKHHFERALSSREGVAGWCNSAG